MGDLEHSLRSILEKLSMKHFFIRRCALKINPKPKKLPHIRFGACGDDKLLNLVSENLSTFLSER